MLTRVGSSVGIGNRQQAVVLFDEELLVSRRYVDPV